MVLDRNKLKKLLKEKGVKSLEDFNTFMRDVSKDVVETLLEEELTDHLGFEKYDQKAKTVDNSRNGYTPKTVKSKFGEIDLSVPRDRKSEFKPQVVKKSKRDISGLEEKIISMYAKGMTTRDIQAHIKDLYNYDISPKTVSSLCWLLMNASIKGGIMEDENQILKIAFFAEPARWIYQIIAELSKEQKVEYYNSFLPDFALSIARKYVLVSTCVNNARKQGAFRERA